MTSGKLWPGVDVHEREREAAGPERLLGQAQQHDRVLAAAEQQDGPLELGGDLAHDVDGLALERVEVGELVAHVETGLGGGQGAGATAVDEEHRERRARRGADEDGRRDVDARLGQHAERGGEEHDTERGAQRRRPAPAAAGRADPHAGQRADEDRAPSGRSRRCRSTKCARPATHSSTRGVEDVGADDALRAQLVEQDQREADERAGADRGQAEDEAEHDADGHGADLADAALERRPSRAPWRRGRAGTARGRASRRRR